MKAGKHDGLTSQHQLENFLFTYRTTPDATTGTSPCSLFLGRDLRTKLDLLHPDVERCVHEKQAVQKRQHDQHAQERNLVVGQKVMVKNFRPGPTWVPGEITKQLGPVTFEIRVCDGQTWKRHVDHIKTLGEKDILKEVSKEQEPEDCGDFLEILPTSSATPESAAVPSTEEPPTTAFVPRRYPTRERHPPNWFSVKTCHGPYV